MKNEDSGVTNQVATTPAKAMAKLDQKPVVAAPATKPASVQPAMRLDGDSKAFA